MKCCLRLIFEKSLPVPIAPLSVGIHPIGLKLSVPINIRVSHLTYFLSRHCLRQIGFRVESVKYNKIVNTLSSHSLLCSQQQQRRLIRVTQQVREVKICLLVNTIVIIVHLPAPTVASLPQSINPSLRESISSHITH